MKSLAAKVSAGFLLPTTGPKQVAIIMPPPNGLEAYMFLSCSSVRLSVRPSVRPLRFSPRDN